MEKELKKIHKELSDIRRESSDMDWYIKNEIQQIKKNNISNINNVSNINDEIKSIHDDVRDVKNEAFTLHNDVRVVKDEIYKLKQMLHRIESASNEILWSEIFNNSIYGSSWCVDKSFSPGRWAVGYQMLYVIFRTLDSVKPKGILELGLGQSTKLIGQYVNFMDDVKHYVVEHDAEWIEFFTTNDLKLNHSNVVCLDIEKKKYYENEMYQYNKFKESFQNEKFNLIVIDAPFGNDTNELSRVDTLTILPECLEDDFIILIDDYNRKGEKKLLEEICVKLNNAGIEYEKAIYRGNKETAVITSKSWKFLCTL